MVKGITYILVNNSSVGTLVGNNIAGTTKKIYPIISTQSEKMPLVTVYETSRVPEFCRGSRPTTFNYTYEIHVYSTDYEGANSICVAIVDALEEANTASPINGVKYTDRIRNTNRRDNGYIEDYKAYAKVLTFEAVVYEGQAT